MVFFMSFYIGFYESINASPSQMSEENLSAILLPINRYMEIEMS